MRVGVHLSMNDFGREEVKNIPRQLCIGSPLSLPSYTLAKVVKREVDTHLYDDEELNVLHSSFLINLAAWDEGKRKRAVGMSKYTLKTAETAGCFTVVFHAGSGKPSSALSSLREILAVNSVSRILLENDAGGGKRVGSIKVLAAMKKRLEGEIGLCFDTAHSYCRGETRNLKALKAAYDYCKPELIHLNDPNPEVEFGSHLDRHNRVLGEGKYGEDIFKFALYVGDKTPMIIEAPLEVALGGLKRLREYRGEGYSGAI